MRDFVLIGASGYVAPRHMKAIQDTGNRLVAAMDPNDSIGILDSFFPDAHFFTEFERFDRFVDKRRRSTSSSNIDFISICSPNYLHDSHVRFALRSEADAICEKPLVLNPWNIDGLEQIELDTGKRVHTILQLRLHPSVVELRERVKNAFNDKKYEVDLTYITSRGRWYLQSWKGDAKKAGGVATNIGIHFFDMLHFVFGELQENKVHLNDENKAAGYLEFANARVRWFLSIDEKDLPSEVRAGGQRTYRSITMQGEEIEFSDGFADLHTKSYEGILSGEGFGLSESRIAVEAVAHIRSATISLSSENVHPFVVKSN